MCLEIIFLIYMYKKVTDKMKQFLPGSSRIDTAV